MARHSLALTFALLAILATPAWAWMKMLEGKQGSSYIDVATISRNGDLAQVWQLQNLDQAGRAGEMSRQLLVEYDCTDQRSRVLSYTLHSGVMASGMSLPNENIVGSDPGAWNSSEPNSPARIIHKYVCSVQI